MTAKEGTLRLVLLVCLLGAIGAWAQATPQTDAPSIAILEKQAASDDVKAQLRLGLRYDLGQGVAQDHTQAAEWYRKAAERGNADAQTLLGAAYAGGRGITQDYTQAAVWYSKAAVQGDALAQRFLGLL
jgi:hypothetical protein